MSCPLMMDFPFAVSPEQVLQALASIGISFREVADQCGRAWICTRGQVSFHLLTHQESDVLFVVFSADLSRWRWWNFLMLWLLSFRYARKEIQLQRDAFFALKPLGPIQVEGGEMLGLERDAAPGAMPTQAADNLHSSK